jgi:DNA processing protein
MDLQERGGIISEFPLGTNPLPQYFPARNRIISGLADTILVMEAKEKSGSLITADTALEQGRDVYALPGPINSRLSMGCNRLIRQGAGILLSPEELLVELGICQVGEKENDGQIKLILETAEELVYSCLGLQPQNLDYLFNVTKIPIQELLDVLMRLQLKGVVKEISKNYYVRMK